MKPVIGILGNVEVLKDGAFIGNKRSYLTNTYVNAVEKSGGVPIIIPVNTVDENIGEQVKRIDGIILSGGIDVNPSLYNEDPKNKLGFISPDLDEFNLKIIQNALSQNKPILGICRGLQILNVALGGSLHQDLSYIDNCNIKHVQDCPSCEGTHLIKVDEGSKLRDILGDEIYVNSYHHQSIKKLGENLRGVAYSNDKIIEAVEKDSDEFVVGVQFHPEAMVETSQEMLNLFRYFINECEKSHIG